MLRGVDTAAFVVSLAVRLHSRGASVGLTAIEDASRVLVLRPSLSRSELYWTTRVTLIRRHDDLAVFDRVFAAVFDDAVLAITPPARRSAPVKQGANASVQGQNGSEEHGSGLPWATLPPAIAEADNSDAPQRVPHRLPSHLSESAEQPFEQLSEVDLRQLGAWLENAITRWPTRRSRRVEPHHAGHRISLRRTIEQAKRTAWEPVHLVKVRPSDKPRRVVMLCDVSQSMQAPSVAYLHLMRALVRRTHAEAFAFATELTRLTRVLKHRSAEEAFERANEAVADRFGGTRIATSLQALLSSHHRNLLRGAVVLIASDGWDSDQPEAMSAAMARLRRRAHRVIWLNPRAEAAGFEPKVATMAAALPHCHALLPAGSFASLARVIAEVPEISSRG
ncbi:vWA domain-containing protein [Kineosporia babensis]|uniref:VWA domain-containing protein n=1 Tax=Kineosporia babensis TaxID=499548 RepID=A0A9X1SXS9_9ACTN|nr:VWA domain-containing protein [Kineosporia babensis]MCD5316286.1 VWA domain-containing protein [Kineosporia babensis]